MTAIKLIKKTKIKTKNDFLENLEAISDLFKYDVQRILIKKEYFFSESEFEERFYKSIKQTLNTIQKTKKNGEKFKGVKRFLSFNNINKMTNWLVQRLVSNIENSLNDAYTNLYVPYSISFKEHLKKYDNEIEKEILQEELHKMPKEKLIKALKKVWEDAKYEENFDAKDIKELCEKYNINIYDVISRQEFEAPNIIKKTDKKTGKEYLYFADLLN